MTKEMIEELRVLGYRITPIRKAVLDLLKNQGGPLSAQDILVSLGKKKIKPNKTTIYREIDFLHEVGLVKEVRISSTKRMYEITALGHHHHLVCMKCDEVEDLPMPHDMDRYEKNIQKNTSFKILDHSLEFFGLCARCQ